MSTIRCALLACGLVMPVALATGGPLRDEIRAMRDEPIERSPEQAPEVVGAPGADAGEGLTDEEGLAARLDALFADAISAGEVGGDALARAYLEAADLLASRGEPAAAAASLREADLWAASDRHRATARFNYAQIRYLQAVAAMTPGEGGGSGPDVGGAKAALRDAAGAFRAVLDIAPGDGEAARNVERVRRMIRAIEEMERRAREAADAMREQAEQLDELADRQQQESMQNDQGTQSGETASSDQNEISGDTLYEATAHYAR